MLPCTSTTFSPGGGGSGACSRATPTPTQPASTAAPAIRQRQPSAGSADSRTVRKVSPGAPIQAAGWIITSPGRPGSSHTLAHGFHGKPVAMNCRARSASTQPPASASTRGQPRRASRASPAGTAMNSASTAASAGTASGTSHQKRAASTRIASVTQ